MCKHKHLFKDPREILKLQNSTRSSLIQCNYYLRITTEYEGDFCCSHTPAIDIPIVIYNPDIVYFDESVRPENWQPAVLPEYNYASGNVGDANQDSANPIITTSYEPVENIEKKMQNIEIENYHK
jgi:hypothetical protein